jgi:hypothetical protein
VPEIRTSHGPKASALEPTSKAAKASGWDLGWVNWIASLRSQ